MAFIIYWILGLWKMKKSEKDHFAIGILVS